MTAGHGATALLLAGLRALHASVNVARSKEQRAPRPFASFLSHGHCGFHHSATPHRSPRTGCTMRESSRVDRLSKR